jgi:hypothetical protein
MDAKLLQTFKCYILLHQQYDSISSNVKFSKNESMKLNSSSDQKNIEQNLKLYVDCGGEEKKKWVLEKNTQE